MTMTATVEFVGPVRPDKLPRCGPYAVLAWNERAGKYLPRLNDEGRRVVGEFLEQYPKPIRLLVRVWGSLYGKAKAAGLTNDEIASACYEGVVLTAVRFDPSRNVLFSTVVAWGVRGAVCDLLRNRLKDVRESPMSELLAPNRRGDGPVATYLEPAAREGSGAPDAVAELDAACRRAGVTARERAILEGRSYGVSLAALAREWGCSKERVRQVAMLAAYKVRKRCPEGAAA